VARRRGSPRAAAWPRARPGKSRDRTPPEIGLTPEKELLTQVNSRPVKPFKNLTLMGIILPFKNLTLAMALEGGLFRA